MSDSIITAVGGILVSIIVSFTTYSTAKNRIQSNSETLDELRAEVKDLRDRVEHCEADRHAALVERDRLIRENTTILYENFELMRQVRNQIKS